MPHSNAISPDYSLLQQHHGNGGIVGETVLNALYLLGTLFLAALQFTNEGIKNTYKLSLLAELFGLYQCHFMQIIQVIIV